MIPLSIRSIVRRATNTNKRPILSKYQSVLPQIRQSAAPSLPTGPYHPNQFPTRSTPHSKSSNLNNLRKTHPSQPYYFDDNQNQYIKPSFIPKDSLLSNYITTKNSHPAIYTPYLATIPVISHISSYLPTIMTVPSSGESSSSLKNHSYQDNIPDHSLPEPDNHENNGTLKCHVFDKLSSYITEISGDDTCTLESRVHEFYDDVNEKIDKADAVAHEIARKVQEHTDQKREQIINTMQKKLPTYDITQVKFDNVKNTYNFTITETEKLHNTKDEQYDSNGCSIVIQPKKVITNLLNIPKKLYDEIIDINIDEFQRNFLITKLLQDYRAQLELKKMRSVVQDLTSQIVDLFGDDTLLSNQNNNDPNDPVTALNNDIDNEIIKMRRAIQQLAGFTSKEELMTPIPENLDDDQQQYLLSSPKAVVDGTITHIKRGTHNMKKATSHLIREMHPITILDHIKVTLYRCFEYFYPTLPDRLGDTLEIAGDEVMALVLNTAKFVTGYVAGGAFALVSGGKSTFQKYNTFAFNTLLPCYLGYYIVSTAYVISLMIYMSYSVFTTYPVLLDMIDLKNELDSAPSSSPLVVLSIIKKYAAVISDRLDEQNGKKKTRAAITTPAQNPTPISKTEPFTPTTISTLVLPANEAVITLATPQELKSHDEALVVTSGILA